jgi:CheY-like chemotaxis protein
MPVLRKVLIADPDVSSVRPLVKALRAAGFSVQVVADGAKALELSVLRHPDLVVFDNACQFIDAQAFAQILRSNPRTEHTPVVITGTPDSILSKPYQTQAVVSRVGQLVRRAEAAQRLGSDGQHIEGALTQLAVGDLLQLLGMNRRTGRLTLSEGSANAEVFVTDGRPVHARQGVVEGEKALFRVLAWQQGAFAFAPTPPCATTTITRTMEAALLEGARHVDERQRLLALLPHPGVVLRLSATHDPLVDPHPVTAQVLAALAVPKRVEEVLDAGTAPDVDLLAAMASLTDKGWVVAEEGTSSASLPLVSTADAHSLRGLLLRPKAVTPRAVAKLLVVGGGATAGRAFLKQLAESLPSLSDPSCLRSTFGTLATVPVSEALHLDFVMVPPLDAARPLWRPFTAHVMGALVLDAADAFAGLTRFAAFELRVPLVLVTGGAFCSVDAVPPFLKGAPGGTRLVTSGLRDAVRALVLAIVTRQPEGLETVRSLHERSREPRPS